MCTELILILSDLVFLNNDFSFFLPVPRCFDLQLSYCFGDTQAAAAAAPIRPRIRSFLFLPRYRREERRMALLNRCLMRGRSLNHTIATETAKDNLLN